MPQKVLVVTSSPMGEMSVTNHAAKTFTETYKQAFPGDTVDVLDLAKGLEPFNAARVQAKFALYGGPSGADAIPEYKATADLIAQFLAADKIVISAPWWNGLFPDNLKLWLDHIIQPHKVFNPQSYAGLVTGKPVVFLRAAAGSTIGSETDVGLAYLYATFAFMGFKDIKHLGFTGTASLATASPEDKKKFFENVEKQVSEVAKVFKFDDKAEAKPPALKFKAAPTPAPEGTASGCFLLSACEQGVPVNLGPNVLHVSSSPMAEKSVSKTVIAPFLESYKRTVPGTTITELDLAALVAKKELPAYSAVRVQAKFAKFAGKDAKLDEAVAKEWAHCEAWIKQIQEADTIVLSVPMWNWTIPFSLSNWFHQIIQPSYTFDAQTWAGLLPDTKKVFVAVTAGGPQSLGGPLDYVTPYLRQSFAFIGIPNIVVVHVNGGGEEAVQAATKTLLATANLS